MSKQKEGGSAFPMIESDTHGDGRVFHFSTGGMTLRDYFAGQALAGLMGDYTIVKTDETAPWIANFVYKMADAMIAEREKQNDA